MIIRVSSSRTIPAPAATLYDIIADYQEKHPAILPRPPFGELVVERGGHGAGTEIRVTMTALGRDRTFRAIVTEPEPGRVIAERDPESGLVTTFTAEPLGPESTEVTIATEWSAPVPRAWFERLVAPRLLRKTYAEELQNLEAAATGAGGSMR